MSETAAKKSKCHQCGAEVHPVTTVPGHPPAIIHSYDFERRGVPRVEFCSADCGQRWSEGYLAREKAKQSQMN